MCVYAHRGRQFRFHHKVIVRISVVAILNILCGYVNITGLNKILRYVL